MDAATYARSFVSDTRALALAIWDALDNATLYPADPDATVSNFDYYAVWGLCHAITSATYKDESTTYDQFVRWHKMLDEVWNIFASKYDVDSYYAGRIRKIRQDVLIASDLHWEHNRRNKEVQAYADYIEGQV